MQNLLRVSQFLLLAQIVQSDLVFQMIVTEPYSTFVFESFYQPYINAKITDLNLEAKLTQRCSHEACPELSCPGGNYTYFSTQACEGRGERVGDLSQHTYVEYKLQDKTMAVDTFIAREFDAGNKLVNIHDTHDTITHSNIVGWSGVSQSPMQDPVNGDSDDSLFNKSWFWAALIIPNVLILLCCLYCCFIRKKKKNQENGYNRQAKSAASSQMGSPYPIVYSPSVGSVGRNDRHAIGESVEAHYNGEWLPATIMSGDYYSGYGILWEDGSFTPNVHGDDVRPINGSHSTEMQPRKRPSPPRESPTRNPIAEYSSGDSVLVHHQGIWQPAVIVEGSSYTGYGIRWPDGTFAAGVRPQDIRLADDNTSTSAHDTIEITEGSYD
eukprot:TRINITY_DN25137_c0_g1_i1.p1 TRINITY_DN25137_c0_g1~~TRINITY_DN25137_c0_g1_i1.p1  ORF type:complete len:382 (+),score=56.11 TRINITY_DN25137_c0_g1_i1:51-1196(+)